LKYFEKQGESKKTKGATQVGAGGLVGYHTVTSGVPRLLGLKTEQHVTTRQAAKEIKKTKFLDPSFGGKGMSKTIGVDFLVENSKKNVHISGYKDLETSTRVKIFHPVLKRLQKVLYKSVAGLNLKNKNLSAGLELGPKSGRRRTTTFYTTNSDKYYDKNFKIDYDSGLGGLKTKKEVPVSTNKLNSLISGIKRTGVKGILEAVKKNPRRPLIGLGILGSGVYATKELISGGIKNIQKK
jgi:hypothetical protein